MLKKSLPAAYVLILDEFNKGSFPDKINLVQDLIDSNADDAIAQLAEVDVNFVAICNAPRFDEAWVSLWSTYGAIIAGDEDKALYDQPRADNKFELFLGIYYYYQALIAAKDDKKSSEVDCLIKAIKCNSIHACQRYNEHHLYPLIQNDNEYSEDILRSIIKQIKPLLPIYGAYAYIMLAEAYVRYGMFLQHDERPEEANEILKASMRACKEAEKAVEDNKISIYNASFGGTLAASNTLGFGDVKEALTFVRQVSDGSAPASASNQEPAAGSGESLKP